MHYVSCKRQAEIATLLDGKRTPGEIARTVNLSPANSMAYCLLSICNAAFETLYA